MISVPTDNVVQLRQPDRPQVDQKYMMMAAAMMHQEGKLGHAAPPLGVGHLLTEPEKK